MVSSVREERHEGVVGIENGGGGHAAHGEMPVKGDSGLQFQWCRLLDWRQAAQQRKAR